jgi:hypothetical protein
MLFTAILKRKKISIYSILIVLFFSAWIFSDSKGKKEDFSEVVKVALRDAGNQLLLSNLDSTSLVLPIIELEKTIYRLSFQNQLSFEPSDLVSVVKKSFHKATLPKYYRVEVIQCSDNEVAYSYQIKNESEKDIIPCLGRILPQNCYVIEVKFAKKNASVFEKQFFLIGLIFLLISFFAEYQLSNRKNKEKSKDENIESTQIGVFQFYPQQNKLVKQATEISLSRKECELLAIFVANPNQIIRRDELTKKVWEDNGVFVGRSLDTYISKLRKKLKDDTSVKLTNIHGVGYKLEID